MCAKNGYSFRILGSLKATKVMVKYHKNLVNTGLVSLLMSQKNSTELFANWGTNLICHELSYIDICIYVACTTSTIRTVKHVNKLWLFEWVNQVSQVRKCSGRPVSHRCQRHLLENLGGGGGGGSVSWPAMFSAAVMWLFH